MCMVLTYIVETGVRISSRIVVDGNQIVEFILEVHRYVD